LEAGAFLADDPIVIVDDKWFCQFQHTLATGFVGVSDLLENFIDQEGPCNFGAIFAFKGDTETLLFKPMV
jgi:hypothetical protein